MKAKLRTTMNETTVSVLKITTVEFFKMWKEIKLFHQTNTLSVLKHNESCSEQNKKLKVPEFSFTGVRDYIMKTLKTMAYRGQVHWISRRANNKVIWIQKANYTSEEKNIPTKNK